MIEVPVNIKDAHVAPLANGEFPNIGAEVFCCGFPFKHDLTFSSGTIRRYLYNKQHFIHIEATNSIWMGMSGGGIFDKQGKYIGVLEQMSNTMNGPISTFSDYISSYEVLKFLEFNGFNEIVDFHVNQ